MERSFGQLHIACVAAISLYTSGILMADTIYVPGDQPTIQAAIDVAVNGDEVVIANGTYTGTGNRDLDFDGKAITVRSASGDPALCIIDCQGTELEAHRGFYFRDGEGANSIVAGITITNGYAYYYGGGIYCDDSSPTISNCIISNNESMTLGGGIACRQNYSDPMTISNCIIVDNVSAEQGGGAYFGQRDNITVIDCTLNGNTSLEGSGGGIYIYDCDSFVITDCLITENECVLPVYSNGGGISVSDCDPVVSDSVISYNISNGEGGGIHCYKSSAILSDCMILNNESLTFGGGVYYYDDDTSLIMTNCIISDNISSNESDLMGGGGGVYCKLQNNMTLIDCIINRNVAYGGGGGGGVLLDNCDNYVMTNCLIADNLSSGNGGGGGGISCSGDVNITNCTITGNESTWHGHGIDCESSDPQITNCIVWGNGDGSDQIRHYDPDDHPTVSYCNVQDGWIYGVGNIDADPLFIDPANGDFHLGAGTLCIDSGDNNPVSTTTDLDSNPRFVDDPGMYDTGNGISPFVDMGCYEFQGSSSGIPILIALPRQLIEGQTGSFIVTGANPVTSTYLVYSIAGLGSHSVPLLNVTLDITNPIQAGVTKNTNANGNVIWNLPISTSPPNDDKIWFQSCQYELKTNVVATSVQ